MYPEEHVGLPFADRLGVLWCRLLHFCGEGRGKAELQSSAHKRQPNFAAHVQFRLLFILFKLVVVFIFVFVFVAVLLSFVCCYYSQWLLAALLLFCASGVCDL